MQRFELLKSLQEAKAPTICPDCGRSIANNHYWYKGQRKCKAGGQTPPPGQQPQPQRAAPVPAQQPQPAAQPTAIPQLPENVLQFLHDHELEGVEFNTDGSINVNGSVHLIQVMESELPIKFDKVTHGFFIRGIPTLTTFANFPNKIGGSLEINEITTKLPISSFETFNIEIGEKLILNLPRTEVNNFVGLPAHVRGEFAICVKTFGSLEGLPRRCDQHVEIKCMDTCIPVSDLADRIEHIGGILTVFTPRPSYDITKEGISVLSAFHIEGLKNIQIRFLDKDGRNSYTHHDAIHEVMKIINKHLKSDDRDIYACQQDLIDAGLDHWAQL